jgi:hypothetical protein
VNTTSRTTCCVPSSTHVASLTAPAWALRTFQVPVEGHPG